MAINGRNYNSGEVTAKKMSEPISTGSSHALNLGKVFGIMFIWLLVTTGIAFGVGYLFARWIGSLENPNPQAVNTLTALMAVSGITLLILTFVIQLYALRKDKGMLPLSILYVISMGVLCSTMTLFIDWQILGIAFGITTLIFGILALIGFLARNVTPIAIIGIMVVVGASLTVLITWLMSIWLPINTTLLWILDFAIFGGMLLLIIVDLHNINKICKSGEMSKNLTLYCALTLYTDFVYIFIKIVYYLALANSRN